MWVEALDIQRIAAIHLYSQPIYDNISLVRREVLSRINWVSNIWDYINSLSESEKYEFDLEVIRKIILHISLEVSYFSKEYSVNISPTTLSNPRFRSDIALILSSVWISFFPSNISFEVTESWRSLNDLEISSLLNNITSFRSNWTKFWLDDFPIGNSLWLASAVSFDFIKIDKIYIMQLIRKEISENQFIQRMKWLIFFIDSICDKAIDIVIEWIENEYILNLIKQHFWDRIKFFQWFLYWRPSELEITS